MNFFRTALSMLVCSVCGAVALAASEVVLPAGKIVNGFVDDKGRALLVVQRGGHPRDGSVLVRLQGNKARRIALPGISVGRFSALSNGRLLLSGLEMSGGNGDAVKQIVGVGSRGEIRPYWKFSSREFDPLTGSHGVPITVSGDGRAWGLVDDSGTGFVFGRTRSRRTGTRRSEIADVGSERDSATSGLKWPIAPGFLFLDSDGPVILTPWSGGAYILHFATNGSSPYAVPILFGDGIEEYDFRWQWEERVLWVRTSLYWKAYNLWDLGLSPMQEEPFLVVEKAAEPHPQRGAVQLATQKGRYRVEHLWRDPWAPTEESHVSEWRSGRPAAFFVSPSGRHAIVLESRESEEGGSRTYAELVALTLVPPIPPIEPDPEAEIAADQAAMPWLKVGPGREREEPEAAADGQEGSSRGEQEKPEVVAPPAEPGEPPER